MTRLPPPKVRIRPNLQLDGTAFYAFYDLKVPIVQTEPLGLPVTEFKDGYLIGPHDTPIFSAFDEDGFLIAPRWTARQRESLAARQGAEVGDVRFTLPRPAHTPFRHLAGGVQGGSGTYTRLNAFSWVRRQCAVEVTNFRITHLGGGRLSGVATVEGRGSLVALLCPIDNDWRSGFTAVSGAVFYSQEREREIHLKIPPGAWRLVLVAGNEMYADTQGVTLDPADDCYEPLDLSPVTFRAGHAHLTVTLPRPGACVVTFIPRPTGVTAHPGHPRFGVQATTPEQGVAVAAAWIGPSPAALHRARMPVPQGSYALAVFGSPSVLIRDLNPYK